MQNYAIQCNTMQYHASLISADGAYHCPVGSIMAIFYLMACESKLKPGDGYFLGDGYWMAADSGGARRWGPPPW